LGEKIEIISKSYLSTFGVTRAKEKLYLIAPIAENINSYNEYPESRFLLEIK